MKVAELIFNAIKVRDIEYVFCVPGESFLATMDAFYGSEKPKLISTRHEEGAGIMADVYAKATGKTGVCIVTRGPGLTHLSIALHTAKQDSTPLVAFVGQVSRNFLHREAFQEINVVEFAGPVCKWAVELNNTDLVVELVDMAFHIAESGRPGPVIISIPEDIDRSESSKYSVLRKADSFSQSITEKGARNVSEMICEAKRPCIVAGEGVLRSNLTERLVEFTELTSIPVLTAWRRFDAFPNKHNLYLGALHISSNSNILAEPLKKADLVIAIGTRMDEFSTLNYSIPKLGQKLIQIDHSASDSGGNPSGNHLYIAVEAGEALIKIVKALKTSNYRGPSKARQKELKEWQKRFKKLTTPQNWRKNILQKELDLEGIYYDITKILDDDVSIACDAGDFSGWLVRYYKWNKPHTFFGPTSGAMGYALPAAISAKLARPKFPSIAFAGDGGFAMTMCELETAVRYKLESLVAIVFNNNCYGTISRHQNSQFPGRLFGTSMGKISFADIAKAMGARGYFVKSNQEFSVALKSALGGEGPAVIEISVNNKLLGPWENTKIG